MATIFCTTTVHTPEHPQHAHKTNAQQLPKSGTKKKRMVDTNAPNALERDDDVKLTRFAKELPPARTTVMHWQGVRPC